MSKKHQITLWIAALLTVGLWPDHTQAQWSTSERGTLLGAVTGGGAGAAIGKKSGNPIVGAVVGSLGGALVGNAIGDGIEQRRAAEIYQQQQQYAYQNQGLYQNSGVYQNPGVSLDQVVQLTRSGVGDDLIVSHVEQTGFNQRLSTNDMIWLKNQGVSDRVILALQRPQVVASAPAVYSPAVRYAPPVTVVEEVHVVPAWHGPSYYYPRPMPVYGYPRYHHHRSSSANFHFRF